MYLHNLHNYFLYFKEIGCIQSPSNVSMVSFLGDNEYLDWQHSQSINIVGKDDVNPADLISNKERLREMST